MSVVQSTLQNGSMRTWPHLANKMSSNVKTDEALIGMGWVFECATVWALHGFTMRIIVCFYFMPVLLSGSNKRITPPQPNIIQYFIRLLTKWPQHYFGACRSTFDSHVRAAWSIICVSAAILNILGIMAMVHQWRSYIFVPNMTFLCSTLRPTPMTTITTMTTTMTHAGQSMTEKFLWHLCQRSQKDSL